MSEINGSGDASNPTQEQGMPASQSTPTGERAPQREYFTKRQTLLVAASTVVAAALGVGCVFGVQSAFGARGTSSAQQQYTGQPAVGQHGGGLGGYGAGGYGYGSGGYGDGAGAGQPGSGSGAGSTGGNPFGGNAYGQTSGGTTSATAAESKGIVLIDTQLGYQSAEAAGTGLVLTSGGEILTNNHVIEGSTSIKVQVVATGKSYTATVVGDDPTDDVAVLQLQGASGLATAVTDGSHKVTEGESITGVGNAEGGGSLVAAPGEVTGLDQSITTEAEDSAASESLHGLIETNAAIEPGDSGGPLFDSSDKVVGIDTAASSGGAPDGYAIPIATALDIAKEITSGHAGGSIELGYPAFLGIELGETDASGFGGFAQQGSGAAAQGAQVAGVVSGGPAEEAGLAEGDVITAIGGTSVASADDLQAALKSYAPGDHVSISWIDGSGQSHTASVTLTQGPAA
ncbi:S1C family serine protease [Gryllotalpicola protaetiae]|uniref:PDZ domain-containing protein n=1 Tax=Gryllotalpicola protaetiae TaxID=2419771 RepID=A0A387BPV4_9MICO|nr:trypsin-like peptidase domain-containing protein [Gryllotalpicola protaetiae]AYG03040.1 PDZ domain-containing protein [Gryllotalpicola protaetiae]